MMYTIIMQPLALPRGEYSYPCDGDEYFVKVYRALETLGADIIDVLRDGESLTVKELAEVLGE